MNKLHIFFIDEQNSSRQNGIGTYRDILLSRLKSDPEIEPTLLTLNADCDNIEVAEHEFGIEYRIPKIANGNWRQNGKIIWPMLRLYIEDSPRNIFIFNHSPAAEFIIDLQSLFPSSRTVFVIHNQGWCAPLWGDSKLLIAIEQGKFPAGISESTAKSISKYCEAERAIYKAVDRVVCLSESTHSHLINIYGVDDKKIHLIHNGFYRNYRRKISKDTARKQLGLYPDEELLLFVGRPTTIKGIIPLMKAISILRSNHPKLRLALIGQAKGFLNYWDIGHKIAPNLIIVGHIDHDTLRQWYSAADVGIMASYSEQCSYAALEMMNMNLSIVSSDGNGLRNMFSHKVNAYIAHIGNVLNVNKYATQLAEKIDMALKASNAEKEAMKSAAIQLLRTKYSPDIMTKQYIELFHSLI
ncbi:MAG: glycosyltransferase [Bacteroides sp.]|nr:glycosyltransferase [Bacteroides sp.]